MLFAAGVPSEFAAASEAPVEFSEAQVVTEVCRLSGRGAGQRSRLLSAIRHDERTANRHQRAADAAAAAATAADAAASAADNAAAFDGTAAPGK